MESLQNCNYYLASGVTIWIVRFTPQGEKEHGLYSPTSIHPPPCTYTYLVTRAPPRTASCRGSSLCDLTKKNCLGPIGQRLNLVWHWFSRPSLLEKTLPRNPLILDSPGLLPLAVKHSTLLRGGPCIYHFVPAGSGTCTHHDANPPECPTSTDPPPGSRVEIFPGRIVELPPPDTVHVVGQIQISGNVSVCLKPEELIITSSRLVVDLPVDELIWKSGLHGVVKGSSFGVGHEIFQGLILSTVPHFSSKFDTCLGLSSSTV